jgi:transcription initiation factor TFIID subunit 5
VYSLEFSADNNILVSGGADCTVRVWDVNTEEVDPMEMEPKRRKLEDDRRIYERYFQKSFAMCTYYL